MSAWERASRSPKPRSLENVRKKTSKNVSRGWKAPGSQKSGKGLEQDSSLANRGDSRELTQFARTDSQKKNLFSQRASGSRESPHTCDSQFFSPPKRDSQKRGSVWERLGDSRESSDPHESANRFARTGTSKFQDFLPSSRLFADFCGSRVRGLSGEFFETFAVSPRRLFPTGWGDLKPNLMSVIYSYVCRDV